VAIKGIAETDFEKTPRFIGAEVVDKRGDSAA